MANRAFVCVAALALSGCAMEAGGDVGAATEEIREGIELTDPNMVRLTNPKGTCSGYLLSSTVVLTARHCLHEPGDRAAIYEPSQITATTDDPTNGAQSVPVARYEWPENDVAGFQISEDLALLLLARPLPTNNLRPMDLSKIDGRPTMEVRGFGVDENGNDVLRFGWLDYQGLLDDIDRPFDFKFGSMLLFPGTVPIPFSTRSTLACNGDSGGPIFRDGKLVGVFSYFTHAATAMTAADRCATAKANYAAPLRRHTEWLRARFTEAGDDGSFVYAVPLRAESDDVWSEVRVMFSEGSNPPMTSPLVETGALSGEWIGMQPMPAQGMMFDSWAGGFCPCTTDTCVFQADPEDLAYSCIAKFVPLPIMPPPETPPDLMPPPVMAPDLEPPPPAMEPPTPPNAPPIPPMEPPMPPGEVLPPPLVEPTPPPPDMEPPVLPPEILPPPEEPPPPVMMPPEPPPEEPTTPVVVMPPAPEEPPPPVIVMPPPPPEPVPFVVSWVDEWGVTQTMTYWIYD